MDYWQDQPGIYSILMFRSPGPMPTMNGCQEYINRSLSNLQIRNAPLSSKACQLPLLAFLFAPYYSLNYSSSETNESDLIASPINLTLSLPIQLTPTMFSDTSRAFLQRVRRIARHAESYGQDRFIIIMCNFDRGLSIVIVRSGINHWLLNPHPFPAR